MTINNVYLQKIVVTKCSVIARNCVVNWYAYIHWHKYIASHSKYTASHSKYTANHSKYTANLSGTFIASNYALNYVTFLII